MGARGPAPTPTAILKKRGSWRARSRRGEPQPPRATPTCPDWLDADAKRLWKKVVADLKAAGVLARIDGHALSRYCNTWVRWRKAIAFLEQNGEVYSLRDEAGRIRYLQQFPQVGIANKLAQQLTRLEQEFGMTPASRTRINVEISNGPPAIADPDNLKARFFPGIPA